MIRAEQPTALRIAEVVDEAQDIKTFFFNHELDAEPGQFIMLWLPGINQKPFGISYLGKDSFGVTVSRVGPFTEEVFKLKNGELAGIQGPYGNPFRVDAKNAVLVAGGYGAAPLAFLAEELVKKKSKVKLIIGAQTEALLVYRNRFRNTQVKILYCTDDGSAGRKGFATHALQEVLGKDKTIDMIYTCGPEVMMGKVIELSDEYGVSCEVSLERYMKCGFGVCGQCCVDGSGARVCVEGPVFDKEYVKEHILEFSKHKRDGTGTKVRL